MPQTPSTAQQTILSGIFCILLAMLTLASMDAMVKHLVMVGYSVIFLLAVRGWLITVVLLLWAVLRGGIRKYIFTRRWQAHGGRSLCALLAPLLFFTALRTMPLADATVVFFAAPLVLTSLSAPILGDSVGWHRWIAVLVGFVGVLIAIRPGTDLFQPAALLAFGGCLAYAVLMLLGRWMRDTEDTFRLVFWGNAGVTIAATACLPFVWHPIPLAEAVWILLIAGLALTGHMLITRAFLLAPAGVLAPFEYSSLLWATLFGWLFWRDIPDLYVWVGGGLVSLCGVYIIHREYLTHRRQGTKIEEGW